MPYPPIPYNGLPFPDIDEPYRPAFPDTALPPPPRARRQQPAPDYASLPDVRPQAMAAPTGPAAPSRSWGEAASDFLVGVGTGATGLAGGLANLTDLATFGGVSALAKRAGGALDRALGGPGEGYTLQEGTSRIDQAMRGMESDPLRQRRQQLQERIAAAGQQGGLSGGLEKAWEAAKGTATDLPMLGQLAAEQVPILATMGLGTVGSASRAGQAARAAGATPAAIEQAAQRAAIRSNIGFSGAMGAGFSSQQAAQDILAAPQAEIEQSPDYRAMRQAGMDDRTARAELARLAGYPAAAIAGPASALAAGITAPLETAVFRGQFKGGIRPVVGAALRETAEEIPQESSEQIGTNVGVRFAGVPRDVWANVPEAAGMAGVAGFLMGGALGGVGNIQTRARRAGMADDATQATADLRANLDFANETDIAEALAGFDRIEAQGKLPKKALERLNAARQQLSAELALRASPESLSEPLANARGRAGYLGFADRAHELEDDQIFDLAQRPLPNDAPGEFHEARVAYGIEAKRRQDLNEAAAHFEQNPEAVAGVAKVIADIGAGKPLSKGAHGSTDYNLSSLSDSQLTRYRMAGEVLLRDRADALGKLREPVNKSLDLLHQEADRRANGQRRDPNAVREADIAQRVAKGSKNAVKMLDGLSPDAMERMAAGLESRADLEPGLADTARQIRERAQKERAKQAAPAPAPGIDYTAERARLSELAQQADLQNRERAILEREARRRADLDAEIAARRQPQPALPPPPSLAIPQGAPSVTSARIPQPLGQLGRSRLGFGQDGAMVPAETRATEESAPALPAPPSVQAPEWTAPRRPALPPATPLPIKQNAQQAQAKADSPVALPSRSEGARGARPKGTGAEQGAELEPKGEWERFAPDSGTLGVPRSEMPQIKAEHRGALVNFLKARGISHRSVEMPPSALKPTQAEFSREKVNKAIGYKDGERSILVSRDNRVLDGHHQWLAALRQNKPIPVIRLNAPIKRLLKEAHEFPSSTVSQASVVRGGQTGREAPPTTATKPDQESRDEKVQAEAETQVAPAGKPIAPTVAPKTGVDPDVLAKLERELASAKSAVAREQSASDALHNSDNIPGAYVAGPSKYTLGEKREAMNERLSAQFRRLRDAKERLKNAETRLSGYRSGEFHENGQPRKDAPSRNAEQQAVLSYADFIRATVKKGDRVTFLPNPSPGGISVKSLNKKTVTLETGTTWGYEDISPWIDGKPASRKEVVAAYRAWKENTGQAADKKHGKAVVSPEEIADKKPDIAPRKAVKAKADTPNPAQDSLLVAIAKLGGLDRDEARRQGVDPAEFKRMPIFGKPAFRKSGGKSFDAMAESLSEHGYPVADERGDYSPNALLDAIGRELSGSPVYTPAGHETAARRDAEMDQIERDSWLLDAVDFERSEFDSLNEQERITAQLQAEASRDLGEDIADTIFDRVSKSHEDATPERFNEALKAAFDAARQRESEAGRQQAGEPGSRPAQDAESPLLQDYSLDDLRAEEARLARIESERKAAEAKAEAKAKADKERDSFSLTGSDRPADKAMAAGQMSMLAAMDGKASAPPTTRQSRSSSTTKPATVAQARAQLVAALGERDVAALERSGRLVLHATDPSKTGAAGFVDGDGVVHLIPGNMDQTALDVALHEAMHLARDDRFAEGDRAKIRLAHAVLKLGGLKNFVGNPGFSDLVQQVYRMAAEGNEVAVEALNKAKLEAKADPRVDVAEESVAYLAQYADEKLPLVRRALALIRAALYRIGIKVNLTPADVRALALSALKARAKTANRIAVAREAMAHSRPTSETDAAEQARLWAEFQAVRAQFQARQPIETAFRRWFGKGTEGVTARDGKPLVLYHGTNSPEFNRWDASRAGQSSTHPTAGLGFFMTADKRSAARYGSRLLELHAKIDRPYYLTDADLWAIDSVEAATRMRRKLMALGYDGAVVTAPLSAPYVIAFESRQVKHTTNENPTESEDFRYSRPGRPSRMDSPRVAAKVLGDIGELRDALKSGEKAKAKIDPRNWAQMLSDLKADKRPQWLGLLTQDMLLQLAEKHLPAAEVRKFDDASEKMDASENKTIQAEAFPLAERWQNLMAKDRQQADAMSRLIYMSTWFGVDPRQPAPKGKQVEWTRAKATFDGLTSAEARKLYGEVLAFYEGQTKRLFDELAARIERHALPEPDKLAAKDMLRQEFERMRQEGPYAPLMRFGDLTVWAEPRDRNDKPVFATFESVAEQRAFADWLKGEGYSPKIGVKMEEIAKRDLPQGDFVGKLAGIIDKTAKGPEAQILKDAMYQLFLRSLPEQSIRKHFIHRKFVPGYSADALRTFATFARRSAKQTARLAHADKMGDALDKMAAAVRSGAVDDPVAAGHLVNELDKSYQWAMAPTTATWASRLTHLGFLWHLGASPAHLLLNLSQQAQVTAPWLAGELAGKKGFGAVASAMLKANRNFLASNPFVDPAKRGASAKAARERLENEYGGDMGRALKALEEAGKTDKTQTYVTAQLSEEDNLLWVRPWTRKITQGAAWFFHIAEVINREATAIAAYRLGRESGMDHEAAHDLARRAINESHFDYAPSNRARFMRGNVAKVLTLFKQYSLNITWQLGRNAYLAARGASPREKTVARTKLLGMLGMTFVMAGAVGLPFYGEAMWLLTQLLNAARDDDEPEWDADTEFRALLDRALSPTGEQVVRRGLVNAFSGIDLSSRIKLDDLWWRDADSDLQGKQAAYHALEQALGPVAGLAVRGFATANDAIDALLSGTSARGATWRALEGAMPKAIKDVSKGLRFQTEGATTFEGARVLEPGELGSAASVGQLLGFTPASLAERYAENRAKMNLQRRIQRQRDALLDAYAMAHRQSDEEIMAALREDMAAFNKRYPGMKITDATIDRSLKARARRRAEIERYGGVALDKRLAGMLMEGTR